MRRKQKKGLAIFAQLLFAPVHNDQRGNVCGTADTDAHGIGVTPDTKLCLLYKKHIYCGKSEILIPKFTMLLFVALD